MDELHDREKRLILACEVANAAPEALAIEREWDALSDEIPEPWTEEALKDVLDLM